MANQNPDECRIRFGNFEIDAHSQELFVAGKRIALAHQSFVALATLIERPGQLVTRSELCERLWPDGRIVDFDQGLNAIMNRLREALSSGGGGGLIETLPRRGYRFVGSIGGARPKPGTRSRLIAGVAVALGALMLAGWLQRLNGSGAPAELKVKPLTSLDGRETSPDFSPKGDALMFAWNGGAESAQFDLYARRLDSEHLTQLTHTPALALRAAWAPNGTQIALARQTEREAGVFLISSAGDGEQLLTTANFLDESFMQISWSADGKQLAYSTVDSDGRSGIHIIEPSTLENRLLPKPLGCGDAGLPTFSSDARWLAFVCASSVAVYRIYVQELATGSVRTLGGLQGRAQGLLWASTLDALFASNESETDSGIWRVSLDGHSARLLRSEGTVGPGIAATHGQLAFVRENRLVNIWRTNLRAPASRAEKLISSSREQLIPAYSPDGKRVAFESTRSGNPEIWLADADGLNPVKLTAFNGPLTGAPRWCGDGRRIAFDSRAGGTSSIYVLDVFGGQPHRLDISEPNLSLPVWSLDCRWILASNGRTALYRMPSAGGSAELFTQRRTYRAVVAGSQVIFNVASDNGVELWSKPIEGASETRLAGMATLRYSDSWEASPSGVYFTGSGPPAAISFYSFKSHQTRLLRELEGQPAALGGLGIAISADEQWLLYSRAESDEGDIMVATGAAF